MARKRKPKPEKIWREERHKNDGYDHTTQTFDPKLANMWLTSDWMQGDEYHLYVGTITWERIK